eukprot:scaffold52888_cov70-Phaeocystis_antarctica.AAC.30
MIPLSSAPATHGAREGVSYLGLGAQPHRQASASLKRSLVEARGEERGGHKATIDVACRRHPRAINPGTLVAKADRADGRRRQLEKRRERRVNAPSYTGGVNRTDAPHVVAALGQVEQCRRVVAANAARQNRTEVATHMRRGCNCIANNRRTVVAEAVPAHRHTWRALLHLGIDSRRAVRWLVGAVANGSRLFEVAA